MATNGTNSPLRTRWSSGKEADYFTVTNPATGAVNRVVAGCSVTELNAAVAAAKKAFYDDWRHRSALERSQYLNRAADAVSKHADELAEILCSENGKPVQDARLFDVEFLINIFRYFASLIVFEKGELIQQGSINATVIREPYGVVGAILPFNWPPIHTGGKIAPALAAGNTVVLKPGDQTPLTVMRICEIVAEALPPDVIHCVPAKGTAVPTALVEHPDVHKISFTGSPGAGIAVAKAGASTFTNFSFELGGKNALIVFEDADLNRAVPDALEASVFNKGEACTAGSRVIVHESIHDEFISRLAAAYKKIVSGDGRDKATHVGPQVSKAQQEKVLQYIELGKKECATVAAEGSLPSDPKLKDGYFVKPTLFTNVKPTMRIAQEEIFGPVQVVIKFSSYEEAIAIANGTDFGLVAGIYTQSTDLQWKASRDVEAGMVLVNNYFRAVLGTPFGGVKGSGQAREHCEETLKEYTWAKNIRVPSGKGAVPQWRGARECC
jgi:acyl-CoA reductase-like NAD-dependent aldehyde dehydrogenase